MMGNILFITPIYAGFFGFMFVMLSWRAATLRRQHEAHKMRDHAHGHNELTAAVRAQANMVEYLPFALLLMWMLETMQTNPLIIHGLGMFLIVARLLHLHGLNEPSGNAPTRRLGTRLTWIHIVICALLCFAGSFGIVFAG